MKVLMLDTYDTGAGAAIAACRLCGALNDFGVRADLYVEKKESAYSYVHELPHKKFFAFYSLFRKIENRIITVITKTTNKILHTANIFSTCDISWINNSDYDIVHIHWINGAVSIKDLSKINKPIVWTLHDSWACCGAEHHPNVLENDTRWQQGYYYWNKPVSTKGFDICRLVWNIKKYYWAKKKIIFTAPSNWQKNILKTSKLFGNSKCITIPNILPYEIFYRRDPQEEKCKRNIPTDKKIIGFGASGNMDNGKSIKGTFYLINALKHLPNKENYFVVLFGPAKAEFTEHIPFPFYSAGVICNSNELAELYSCCDCFVNSSIIENLSYTAYESISCQTPVVAFDVGGFRDLINHKENGYLANPYDSKDLAKGILYCLKNNIFLKEQCLDIREKKNETLIVKKYEKLYKNIIEGN